MPRDKGLADKFRGKPCFICGSLDTVGDHIATYGSNPKNDIEINMWSLCTKHHDEKGRGLTSFVNSYPKAKKELLKRGWFFCPIRRVWKLGFRNHNNEF